LAPVPLDGTSRPGDRGKESGGEREGKKEMKVRIGVPSATHQTQ